MREREREAGHIFILGLKRSPIYFTKPWNPLLLNPSPFSLYLSSPKMSLVAGSYERFLWGYKINRSRTLTPLFSFPSHLSAIKTVAVFGTVAVSGGNDDCIKIYDLSTSSEIGSFHHSASITSVAFFSPPSLSSLPRNLFVADADGQVSIYEADPFVLLKTVKVHKKSVNSISVHPSGMIALTVGHDECMAMVNLVRGRRSFFCKLSKEASIVQFDESGAKFFMVVDDKVTVHQAEDAKLIGELDTKKKILCAASGTNGIYFTGGEDKNITAWDTATGKVAYCIENAHAARVKGIVVLSKSKADSGEDPYLVASASSDGVVRVWDMRMADKGKPMSEANTRSRLTCLAGSSIRSLKRPRLEMV